MKVVITHQIPAPAEKMLKDAGHEVIVGSHDFTGANAILSLLNDKITGEVMDAAGPQLKIIANYAVGFDNIDLEAAKKRNIYVTNTPGGFVESVAEHTIALALAVTRRILEADKYVRDNKYHAWEPMLLMGTQLYGKKIGIVGLGRIGSFVAKIAHYGFSMQVLYHTHKPDLAMEAEMGAVYCDTLDKLLASADIVSLHVPLCAETKHLISGPQLKTMKMSSILINTARGAVVDELALIEALKNKTIAGAGLDVFEEESNPENLTVNPELTSLTNIVLTPHIASSTAEARGEMSRIAAENILAALNGQAPPNLCQ